MKKNKLINFAVFIFVICGCEKEFLDTEPTRFASGEQLGQVSSATNLILKGAYVKLREAGVGKTGSHTDYGNMGIKAGLDMMSNDIVLNSFNWYIFWHDYRSRVQNSTRSLAIWNTYYKIIADANSVINTLKDVVRDADQDAVLGQALALKASSLFNLIRIYAFTYKGHENDLGIPVPNRVDFEGKERGTVKGVYDKIIPDLEQAVVLLEGFSRGNKQTIDQSVVYGFLARVYLEVQDWEKASLNANKAKQSYTLMTGGDWLESGFSDITNNEWMWGSDINAETSTGIASFFSHFDSFSDGYAGRSGGFKLIDVRLYSAISDTDLRKQAFVGPDGDEQFPAIPAYANKKFVDKTTFEGDYVYMRAAEMYLMEAEALAQMGNETESAQLLFELVSTRDPEYKLSKNKGEDLLDEIYLQRRIELWGEGFAWYDMKRLEVPLERDYEGSNHKDFAKLNFPANSNNFRFQIPEAELNANPSINPGDQNPNPKG
ncbi:RagB/SusD family nutrient uptake outer membrane protein [Aquimarina agarilytica]|uniref:RagB/SusD family nutrient uptake outer membrane protein n=1 Tax=Aquimarina agarilytica TaxID=1087449 RepID=UPI00028818BA|nr:RagB/SusD family nutrient uptake outer membrane protein [Aquimarina agarilytica]